jgi:hypothetical protein
MLPAFVLEESIRHEDGSSAALDVSSETSRVLLITLGITRIIEQESLDVTLHGSEDGLSWSAAPLLAFPQKFYCGVYALLLDLSAEPNVRYIRAQWKMNRWGRGAPGALFSFYLVAETAEVRAFAAAGA